MADLVGFKCRLSRKYGESQAPKALRACPDLYRGSYACTPSTASMAGSDGKQQDFTITYPLGLFNVSSACKWLYSELHSCIRSMDLRT